MNPGSRPDGPEDWLALFREIGKDVWSRARSLHLDEGARKEIGDGAGGDRTTVFDRELEDIVLSKLKEIGNIRIITEELGLIDVGSPAVAVVVDPLDGSFNAKNGIPHYCLSMALTGHPPTLGNTDIGYVKNLINGDEYIGLRGRGSTLNGKPILASTSKVLRGLGFEFSAETLHTIAHDWKTIIKSSRFRCLGSLAMSLCYVASGTFEATLVGRGTKCRLLDICAGKLIVEEAGGIVTDSSGRSIDDLGITVDTRTDMMAFANPSIKDSILERVSCGRPGGSE